MGESLWDFNGNYEDLMEFIIYPYATDKPLETVAIYLYHEWLHRTGRVTYEKPLLERVVSATNRCIDHREYVMTEKQVRQYWGVA